MALRGALSVVDDCAGQNDLALDLAVRETNHCQAVISAAPVHWCNSASIVGKTEVYTVALDTEPPVVSCGFHASTVPDKFTYS